MCLLVEVVATVLLRFKNQEKVHTLNHITQQNIKTCYQLRFPKTISRHQEHRNIVLFRIWWVPLGVITLFAALTLRPPCPDFKHRWCCATRSYSLIATLMFTLSGWIPDLNQIPRFQQVPHKNDHYPGNLKRLRQYGLASVYVHVAVLRFILQRVDVLWYMSYWGMFNPWRK